MTGIYQRMVSSGLNDVVGGGDPEIIGRTNTQMIERLAPIEPGMRVLDFGCGCGRVAVPLLQKMGSSGSLIGVDIIPEMIQFCDQEIGAQFSNSQFFQLKANNSHYKDWTHQEDLSVDSIDSLSQLDQGSFDIVFAFSVFTHLNTADTKTYLQQIAALLKPNGKALLSVLLINQSSRIGNKLKLSGVPFGRSLIFRKPIYYGNIRDKLASVGYRESTFIKHGIEAGLDVSEIYYGSWPGRRNRDSFQDIISLQPRPKLPKDFDAGKYIRNYDDLPFDPNTKEGHKKAVWHYLNHGYFEGRRAK